MNKLIGMVDFVLEQEKTYPCANMSEYKKTNEQVLRLIINYANFLKQPLKLEMFVPCDDDGNVLESPTVNNNFVTTFKPYELIAWEKAQEKVIFEGLKCLKINNFCFIERDNKSLFCLGLDNAKTIEDLVKYNLILKPNAIKL